MRDILKLVDQLIEVAEEEDRKHKIKHINSKAETTVGEGFMVFHLKQIKKYVAERRENDFKSENNRPE